MKDLQKLNDNIYGGIIYNDHIIYKVSGGWYEFIDAYGCGGDAYDSEQDAMDDIDAFIEMSQHLG